MSGPENTFIRSVHRHLPSTLYHMKNNNMYNSGIADCWYSGMQDLWIEWKFIVVPRRATTMIDLHTGKNPAMSALQRKWLHDRFDEGRNVWVGIGSANGGVLIRSPEKWNEAFSTEWFQYECAPRIDLANEIYQFTQSK